MVGTLSELRGTVDGAAGKKCSPSTIAYNVQNDRVMQKEIALGQQSLEQIRTNEQKGFCGYMTLSPQLNNSVVTLPELGGYRQYVRSKETKSNRRGYYRCNNCHKLKRKTGYGPISNIHIQNGVVIRGKSSAHHPDCKVLSETDIIATQMDRQSRREILEGKDPYDVYRKNFEKAMELAATFDENSSNSKKFNVATAYPSWRSVCKKYKRLRHDRLKQKLELDGSKGEMGECSYEIGEETDTANTEEITPDSHIDDSFVRSTSSLEASSVTSSERTPCEMDNSNTVAEHISAGFSKLDKVSSSLEEAVDGTPDAALEQPSDEEISVDDDNSSTVNNETIGQKMPEGDELSEPRSSKLLLSKMNDVKNDNQSELPVTELLESGQHSFSDAANIAESSSSQSHQSPSTPPELPDSNDNNQTIAGDNSSTTTNEAHPKHFLKRDPQTGRLVLCKRLPLKRVMHSSCIQQSFLNNRKNAHKSSLHQDNSSDEFASNSFVSDVRTRSATRAYNPYGQQTSQPPAKKSRRNELLKKGIVEVDDSNDNNDISAGRVNRSNVRDDCDAILELLGEGIREIEAISKRRAQQLKIDLLKMMSRYRCLVQGSQ